MSSSGVLFVGVPIPVMLNQSLDKEELVSLLKPASVRKENKRARHPCRSQQRSARTFHRMQPSARRCGALTRLVLWGKFSRFLLAQSERTQKLLFHCTYIRNSLGA